MKKLVLALAFFVLSTSAAFCEELPDGFYEMEVVKNAIQEQVASLREFTPAQLEVIYQASRILHNEYFVGSADLRLPLGEYIVGELIKPGIYRVTLVGEDLAVIWVKAPNEIVGDYYSLVFHDGETEAIVRLAEGDSFKVQHASVILSPVSSL